MFSTTSRRSFLILFAVVLTILLLQEFFLYAVRNNQAPRIDKYFTKQSVSDACICNSTDPILQSQPSNTENQRAVSYEEFLMHYRGITGRKPPNNISTWYKFATANKCNILNDYKNIEDYLKPFRVAGGITKKMVQEAVEDGYNVVIDIKNGKANADAANSVFTGKILQNIAQHLPNMRVVVNIHDEPRVLYPFPEVVDIEKYRNEIGKKYKGTRENIDSNIIKDVCSHIPAVSENGNYHSWFFKPFAVHVTPKLLPIFSFSGLKGCFADILLPWFSSYEETTEKLESPSWENKIPKLHWRGSTTGSKPEPTWSKEEFMEYNHRARFAIYYSNNSDMNVGIARITHCENCQALFDRIPHKDPASRQEQLRYKFLWDTDGFGSTGRFLQYSKYSKSVIFKNSMFDDWLTESLVPGVHFIKIPNFNYGNPNATKIEGKTFFEQKDADFQVLGALEWLKENDDIAKQIAQNAFEYGSKNLRREDLDCYVLRLLLEYHALLKD